MDKDAEGREGLVQPAAQGIDNTHLGGIMTGVHQGQPRLPGGQPFVVLHLAGDKGIHGGVQLDVYKRQEGSRNGTAMIFSSVDSSSTIWITPMG